MDRFSPKRVRRQIPRLSSTPTPQRRLRRGLVAITLSVAAVGCGMVMTAPPSGFLSVDDGLAAVADTPTVVRRAARPVDRSRVAVAAVEWRAAASEDITDAERLALTSRLQVELGDSVTRLPAAPHGRPVVLRAAITRVKPVSAALNTASALLLFVPIDRGGATVEIEAIDVHTGEQLAAMRSGYFPPMTELKARFSKLAPAEIALRKAAADFARLLQPA